jgi:hypothetical protein
MCTAYGSSFGENESWGWSDTTGSSHCKSISIGTPIESIWGSSSYDTAQPNTRVKNAAQGLEREIRLLATRLPVADFVKLRIRLEDLFDSILLAGLR